MSDQASRLRTARLNAGFRSARSAALRFQWSPSTYAAHENGQNAFNGNQAVEYARAFKVQPEWLYMGIGFSTSDYGHVFNLTGFVGDNGKIEDSIESEKKLVSLQFFRGMSHIRLFEIATQTLIPVYSIGQVVVTIQADRANFRGGLYQDVIVSASDRQYFLGRLIDSDKDGHFDLMRFGLPPMRRMRLLDMYIVIARIDRLGWLETGEGTPSMLSDEALDAEIEAQTNASKR